MGRACSTSEGRGRVRLPRRAKARTGSFRPTRQPPDTSAADLAWITPRRRHAAGQDIHAAAAAAQSGSEIPAQLHLLHEEDAGRRVPAVLQALQSPIRNGAIYEIDASHSPNVTAPEGSGAAARPDRARRPGRSRRLLANASRAADVRFYPWLPDRGRGGFDQGEVHGTYIVPALRLAYIGSTGDA